MDDKNDEKEHRKPEKKKPEKGRRSEETIETEKSSKPKSKKKKKPKKGRRSDLTIETRKSSKLKSKKKKTKEPDRTEGEAEQAAGDTPVEGHEKAKKKKTKKHTDESESEIEVDEKTPKRRDTEELKLHLSKSSKEPDQFLPLIYDSRRKEQPPKPTPPPPPPPTEPKPTPPPPPKEPKPPPPPPPPEPKPAPPPPPPPKEPKPTPPPPPPEPKPAPPPPPKEPKPIPPPPPPKEQKPPPPPPRTEPNLSRHRRDVEKPKDEPRKLAPPSDEFNEMIQKLTDQIDLLLGKTVVPVEEKEHMSKKEESAFLKLENFSIPQQTKLLQLLYSSGNETRPCHFGGNMWAYYSNILRCFAPINMQGRYRGQGLFAKCMTAIDVSKLGLKNEETQRNLDRKDDMMEKQTDEYASVVAVDEEHYLFLRQIWNYHPSSLPVSMTYENLFTFVPIMQDLYLTYLRRIGRLHPVTFESKKRYDALRDKLESYLKLLLEPIELLETRDPRMLMTEQELLASVTLDYIAADELYEKLKENPSKECLLIKGHHYHDLMEETLAYRQKLEAERNQLYFEND